MKSGRNLCGFLKRPDSSIYYDVAGSGPAHGERMARAQRVSKAGHSVYFERPAEFNRIVEEFHSAT